MKRSAALAALSRDHHHALDAARRLRRADEDTLPEAVAHFETFFATRGSRHFEVEEEVLLPALPASDAHWAQLSRRVLDDHADLRARGADVPDVAAAHELGLRLHDHVRFEERELFEVLEQRLGADGLERLAQELDAADDIAR